MRKTENSARLEGLVYDSKLEQKVTGPNSKNPNTPYISGDLFIKAGKDVGVIHYTYVTELTKAGKKNRTYQALQQIIDTEATVINVGEENALKIQCDKTAFAVSDYFPKDTPNEHRTFTRYEGGFATIQPYISANEDQNNYFVADMLINNIDMIEPDNAEPYVSLKGCVFNFRQDMIPVTMVVRDKQGMEYLMKQDVSASSPMFRKVWGKVNATTISVEKEDEAATAFGKAVATNTDRTVREFLVTSLAAENYPLGDEEEGITSDELKQKIEDRNALIADVKKRTEEYRAAAAKASNGTTNLMNAVAKASPAAGGFDF